MSRYQRHIFICTNRRPAGHPKGCCAEKGSELLKEHYPEGIWYGRVTIADVPELVERHIIRGEVVSRLLIVNQQYNAGSHEFPPLVIPNP